ncbi:MAG: cbb3-type cytochrome c oxidase subunit I [Planctomycetota bacterium]
MSVINTPPPVTNPTDIYGQPVSPEKHDNYLTSGKGFLSWALTLDHKRIGIMYTIGVLGAFLLGGIFAVLLRTELIWTGQTLPTLFADTWTDQYNQMFTLHGAVMTFLFIIPAIPAIIGNFVLPLMLGAKDVAFPRLNLMSLYCWLGGGAFFVYVLASGGLDTGWTFYTPYSTTTNTSVAAATLGAFVLGFSSILTGVNFMASIHMLRPKGMTWFKMPLLLWALYATAAIQILATPVLAITLLLLTAERVIGVGIFDPALGGDPVLYQHFFWFYSHPAVYIMILPALGVTSEIISSLSRKHIFGYKFIAFSSLAIAFFSFIVWGHHMFTSGQSAFFNALFSLLTMTVAIPSAIKVFNWLATIRKGSIRLDTPMLYALGFIWLFTIGGLTGLFLATLNTDIHFHDTYFVVAHFHYVMVGSVLWAFIGGMYYWFPKMFGRMYNEFHGRIAFAITFIGFNLTFFVQFFAGSRGMPRRYADYPDEYFWYHFASTIGTYVLTIGLFYILWNWVDGLIKGRKAPANPWGSNSLEWHTPSPPPHHNFDYEPHGVDPYLYDHWRWDEAVGGYVIKDHDPAHDGIEDVDPDHYNDDPPGSAPAKPVPAGA